MRTWSAVLAVVVIVAGLAPATAVAQRGQLEFWTFIDPAGSGVRSVALAQILKAYEERNAGMKVAASVVQWTEISPTLLRAAKARQVPDLVMLFAPYVPLHTKAGTIQPLDGYLAKLPEQARKSLVLFPEVRGPDGKIYAIPYEMRVGGFIYRKDILDAAGYSPPQTLQEMAEMAGALARGGRIGVTMPFNPKNPSGAMEWLFPTLIGLGVKIFNEDGTAAWVSPQTTRLVQWVYDLVHKHKAMPLDAALADSEESFQLVIAGRAVFRPLPTHRLVFARDRSGLGDALQMMRLLTFTVGRAGPALVQGWTLVIPKGARNADASWKLIELWVSPEMQLMQAKTAGYIPVRREVLSDSWFGTAPAAHVRWALEYAAKSPLNWAFPENPQVLYDVWGRMFEQVLTNRLKVEEGPAWAAREYDSLIRR